MKNFVFEYLHLSRANTGCLQHCNTPCFWLHINVYDNSQVGRWSVVILPKLKTFNDVDTVLYTDSEVCFLMYLCSYACAQTSVLITMFLHAFPASRLWFLSHVWTSTGHPLDMLLSVYTCPFGDSILQPYLVSLTRDLDLWMTQVPYGGLHSALAC